MSAYNPIEDDPRNEWGSKEWYQETLRLDQEIESLQAEIERLRAGINKAGGLALQNASTEIIRQVLAETVAALEQANDT